MKSAFEKIAAGLKDAIACPKCGGWGIGHIETYERSPCPECGLGMGDAMRCNEKGRQLIKDYESLALEAYRCPAGIPTISWGVTGPHVKMGMTISEAEAEQMFEEELLPREGSLTALLQGAETTPDQFAAMFSLLYNIGEQNFANSSVLRFHRAGDHAGAAKAFRLWVKAKVKGKLVVLKGLVRRRAEEARLYLGQL
jgi:lysozyme